jgi:hypothetical protein
MQLLPPEQVPSMIQGRVCRQSRLVSVVGAVVMALMVVGFPLFLLSKAELAGWVWMPVSIVVALIVLAFARLAAKSLRAENWLLRIAPDGLWINLRSYLNRDFAPGATVLFVPYAEIAGVGEHSVKREERNNGRITTWTDRYLEIHLVEPALAELAAEIAEERRRVAEGVHLGGLVTSSGRHHHVPVTVPREDLLRISWRGRQDFVVPWLKSVLRELTAKCMVHESTVDDADNADALTANDLDRLILERVETGDMFGAVKLLRDQRGYSLKDAKQFVDELTVRL